MIATTLNMNDDYFFNHDKYVFKDNNSIGKVVNALKIGLETGCKTIGFSGRGGGEFNEICDINIIVPAEDTARIQEMHILIGHIICQLIDDEFT